MDKRQIVSIVLIVLTLTFFSSFASAQELGRPETVPFKILDLIIVRPISAGVSCLTTALYLGTFPLTYVAGESEQSEKILVEAPWKFTHERALGELIRYRDDVPEIGPPDLSKPSTY